MRRLLATLPGWVWPLLQACVTFGLLAVLWQAADGPEAARSLASADWGWIAAAILALTLQTILSALRWRLTAGRLGIVLGTGHAIREYYLAQVVNQVLPGGMIGDAGRAVRAREQAGLLVSGQAVVFERLAGQIAVFLTLAVAFAVTWVAPGGLVWPRWLSVPVSLLLLAGLALPVVLFFATRLPGAAGRGARSLHRALARAFTGHGALPGQVALSIGTTVCILAGFAASARAVGVTLDLAAITTLVPLILFTMLIPISIAGWGLREGAAAALLPLAGATSSGGLAASVTFGLVFIATVLPGVIFLWVRPRPAAIGTGPG